MTRQRLVLGSRPLRASLFLLLATCGGSPPRGNDVQVMSFAPQGPIEKTEPITIRFDKPVVAEPMVGKPADPPGGRGDAGVRVERRTGRTSADARHRSGGRARAVDALRGRAGRRARQAHRAASSSRSSTGRSRSRACGACDAELLAARRRRSRSSFNQPVRAERRGGALQADRRRPARSRCSPSAGARDSRRRTRARSSASRSTPGGDYRSTCSGARRRRRQRRRSTSRTRSRSARARCSSITAIRPAATTSPPTRSRSRSRSRRRSRSTRSARRSRARPRSPASTRATCPGDGTEYKVTADLDTETDVHASRSPGSSTRSARSSRSRTTHTFRTGDARAAAVDGARHLRARGEREGLPAVVAQRRQVRPRVRRDPEGPLVQVLTTDMNYDPWGGNDDDKPIDWKKLKVKPRRSRRSRPTAQEQVAASTSSSSASCAAAAGKRGVYLAEIALRRGQARPQRSWMSPRRNRVLANVTDLGVLIKTGTSSGLVWVTSLSTGAPIARREGHGLHAAGQAGVDRRDRRRRHRRRSRAARSLKQQKATATRRGGGVRGLGQLPQPAPDRGRREGRRPRDRRRQLVERHPDLELRRDRGPPRRRRRRSAASSRATAACTARASTVHFKGIVREIAHGPRAARARRSKKRRRSRSRTAAARSCCTTEGRSCRRSVASRST